FRRIATSSGVNRPGKNRYPLWSNCSRCSLESFIGRLLESLPLCQCRIDASPRTGPFPAHDEVRLPRGAAERGARAIRVAAVDWVEDRIPSQNRVRAKIVDVRAVAGDSTADGCRCPDGRCTLISPCPHVQNRSSKFSLCATSSVFSLVWSDASAI